MTNNKERIMELEKKMDETNDVKQKEKLASLIWELERIDKEREAQNELAVRMDTELDSAKNNLKIQIINLVITSVIGLAGVGITAWAATQTVKERRNERKAGLDYKLM